MFSFFKRDPLKKLEAEYKSLTERAMTAQRNGDIEGQSKLATQANDLYQQILQLKGQK